MTESRDRVLDAAEVLFLKSGYAAIKLKHIAQALHVKESALYYHFPGGKEELYIAVMQRTMQRHHAGVRTAIAAAGDDWVAQLQHVAEWLLSQQPLDVVRLNHSDLPAIDSAAALAITAQAYDALNLPVRQILERAVAAEKAVVADPDLVAGIFIGMIGLLDIIDKTWNPRPKAEMAAILLDTWTQGLQKHGNYQDSTRDRSG